MMCAIIIVKDIFEFTNCSVPYTHVYEQYTCVAIGLGSSRQDNVDSKAHEHTKPCTYGLGSSGQQH